MDNKEKSIFRQAQDKIIDHVLENSLKDIEWKEYKSSPLSPSVPADEVKNQCKSSLKDLLFNESEQTRIENGMKIIEQNLHRIPEEKLCRENLLKAGNILFNNLSEMVDKLEENLSTNSTPEVPELINEDNTNQDASIEDIPPLSERLGISYATCKAFYQIGSLLFDEKKFDEAECVFHFLSVLYHKSPEIWTALGMCQQKRQDWFSAIASYSLAIVINPANSLPYIYSAECFFKVNDPTNAKGHLKLAEHFQTEDNKQLIQNKINELSINL